MRKKWLVLILLGFLSLSGPVGGADAPPAIKTLVKPAVYEHAVNGREVMTHARLDGDSYSLYAVMQVNAAPEDTRKVLTNYELYPKLISYVKKAQYNPSNRTLEMIGSFMGWTMHSWIRFEERGDRWIHFLFVGGHFLGMSGDMYIEPLTGKRGEKQSLVYFTGTLTQKKWPPIPKTILEWGAEIVFGFTGKHMRSYIESQSQSPSKTPSVTNDQNIPQPRSHL